MLHAPLDPEASVTSISADVHGKTKEHEEGDSHQPGPGDSSGGKVCQVSHCLCFVLRSQLAQHTKATALAGKLRMEPLSPSLSFLDFLNQVHISFAFFLEDSMSLFFTLLL